MNLKVLSLAGLGVLGTGAVGAGGIAMSVGGGQGSEETAKTPSTPTISQRLLDRGYTYNPPKPSHHGDLVQSCTENLLSKTNLDNSKLYGCGVAKLDLWDSGDQFGSEKVDYLQFASELFLRKEDEGWRINTRVDNRSSDSLVYQHLLTYYKKGSGKELVAEESFLIDVGNNDTRVPRVVTSSNKSSTSVFEVGVANTDKKLNIKLPSPAGQWYQGDKYLVMRPYGQPLPPLTKIHKETKTWSGIWIDEARSDKPWMFQDIEVFIGDMTYSQVFCKSYPKPLCGAGTNNMHYRLKYTQESPTASNVWWETANKLIHQSGSHSLDLFVHKTGPVSPVLQLAYSSHGEWVDANSFCKSGSESDINDEDLKQLALYCSKPKV